MPQTAEPRLPLFCSPPPEPVPACHRNHGSPADQALTTIVTILAGHGYNFSIPSWDGDAYLRISNALQALTELTITSHGDITWEYRSVRYPRASEHRLTGTAIELLDPDHTEPLPALPPDHLKLTPLGAIRHALTSYGLTATITQLSTDIGPILTAANPRQPCRGSITITSDGELAWNTRAPHHPDGGVPLPDIAATITRALTRAQHPATRHAMSAPARPSSGRWSRCHGVSGDGAYARGARCDASLPGRPRKPMPLR
jgi:hypothetical protein